MAFFYFKRAIAIFALLFHTTASQEKVTPTRKQGLYNTPTSQPPPFQGDRHKADAEQELQDYYHKENLRTLEQNKMYYAHNHTEGNSSGGNQERLVAFWVFSCSNINNCIAITATGICLLVLSLVVFAVGIGYSLCRSKSRFLPDQWWCAQQREDAKTPLLVVHHVRDSPTERRRSGWSPSSLPSPAPSAKSPLVFLSPKSSANGAPIEESPSPKWSPEAKSPSPKSSPNRNSSAKSPPTAAPRPDKRQEPPTTSSSSFNAEDMLKLKKYLKKYMRMNEKKQSLKQEEQEPHISVSQVVVVEEPEGESEPPAGPVSTVPSRWASTTLGPEPTESNESSSSQQY